jgi:glycine cleavage system aminomethyltransferase T
VSGPDAAEFLERACDNTVVRGVGDVTYTQALNRRGGIECDFTVTRLGADLFSIVTGTAFGTHDRAWLQRQARRSGADVRIADVTGLTCCLALWGPRARDLLAQLTPADLGNGAFPFMTAQELTVGNVPVRALRVTFVGELGWELYASSEYGATLWELLVGTGREYGLVTGGYRAIDSMRVEKGYRVWAGDITAETTPYEAGLGFCVKLDKPGGFEGRDALLAAKQAGIARRLRTIVLDDPTQVVIGNEPVRSGGQVVGRVTSGGFGYSLDASIAFAYLPTELGPGDAVAIDLFGTWIPATVQTDTLFDPRSERVRS